MIISDSIRRKLFFKRNFFTEADAIVNIAAEIKIDVPSPTVQFSAKEYQKLGFVCKKWWYFGLYKFFNTL